MTRDEAIEQLAALCEAVGCEKLPSQLRDRPEAAEVRQAVALLRAYLDDLELRADGWPPPDSDQDS